MRYLPYVHTRHRLAKTGCYVCAGGNDVVAFGVTVLGEGELGICRKHILQAARELGVEDAETVEQLKLRLDEANAAVARFRKDVSDRDDEIGTLRGRVDDLRQRAQAQGAEIENAQRTISELQEQLFSAEEARRDAREGAESTETETGDTGAGEDLTATELEVPDGTVGEVLEWVGEDVSRAQAALDIELQRTTADGEGAARKTVVEPLEKLLEAEAGEDEEG